MHDADTAARTRAEALDLLATCDRTTDRPAVIWAAGVHLVARAHWLTDWDIAGEHLVPDSPRGSSINRGGLRFWHCDDKGWRVTDLVPDPAEVRKQVTLVRGTWDEIADALDFDRVTGELVTAMRQHVDEADRVAAYFDWERVYGRRNFDADQRAELEQMHDLRGRLAELDKQLPALAWDRCRPVRLPRSTFVLSGHAAPRPLRGRRPVAGDQIALFG